MSIVVTVALVQEIRSEKSLEALNKLVPHSCQVLRASNWSTMMASELVPGDIVRVSLGDRVPADLRLFQVLFCSIHDIGFSALICKWTSRV